MDFIILLFLCFAFLGLVLSLLFLLKKKGDRFANAILAIYTFLFATELLNNSLRWSGRIKEELFIHFNLAHFPLWTLYGPLVFIYVRRVVTEKGLRWKDLWFLIPTLIIVATLSPFYLMGTAEKARVVQEGTVFNYVSWPSYGIWLVIALLFFYAFFTYFSFWRSKKVGFRENKWMKWFVGSYFGFSFMFALYIFLTRFNLMDPKFDYFVDIIIVFFIGMLAFFGFVQPEVFEGKSIQKILPFIKYQKTGLSEALSLEMKKKLIRIMEVEQPYLNNELRLDDLSRLMNLSRNHTSQIINEHFNLSFFDFVNKYRVKEAKNLLMNNEENGLTMTQIAYDVGFNNRASFYKAFKKFTEVNPTTYRQQANAS
ncbi:AraC family transcriptional regulator [Flavobacteriaceae bacterium TP-CH-4]|uniref:AraC family transcriptional regulator n=1 Tax=Pelagihabitans pacificus TaxID=2696054 RepID=A0A967E4Q5_9FLAO|nr:helix-turn-helix domain-containing protein [Pelagihabitans pacificus]NHF57780.1 AraC family transcriptional regulator [Pelagihabitans pacificus]